MFRNRTLLSLFAMQSIRTVCASAARDPKFWKLQASHHALSSAVIPQIRFLGLSDVLYSMLDGAARDVVLSHPVFEPRRGTSLARVMHMLAARDLVKPRSGPAIDQEVLLNLHLARLWYVQVLFMGPFVLDSLCPGSNHQLPLSLDPCLRSVCLRRSIPLTFEVASIIASIVPRRD